MFITRGPGPGDSALSITPGTGGALALVLDSTGSISVLAPVGAAGPEDGGGRVFIILPAGVMAGDSGRNLSMVITSLWPGIQAFIRGIISSPTIAEMYINVQKTEYGSPGRPTIRGKVDHQERHPI